jgi:hypothetical protein
MNHHSGHVDFVQGVIGNKQGRSTGIDVAIRVVWMNRIWNSENKIEHYLGGRLELENGETFQFVSLLQNAIRAASDDSFERSLNKNVANE